MDYKKDFELPFLRYSGCFSLWCHLNENHDDELIKEFLSEVFEIEEEILQKFGLPFCDRFSKLMQKEALRQDISLATVKILFKNLKSESKIYMASPVLSDLKLLENAKEYNTRYDDVLPELSFKIRCEEYYTFIYNICFLKNHCSTQTLLSEIAIVKENRLSLVIQNLTDEVFWTIHKDYLNLSKFNLQFLDDFLKNYQDFKQGIEIKSMTLPGVLLVTREKNPDDKNY